ncbi:hypothetical protein Nepgr_021012 [Nepenthes gracilis]|uniref:Uncharacterized protein n=1 Tax=Nepenthes gracilis TaxID=150966 RepID=A0AAD3XWY4_NEPGR|nr:hypothetical protein Nepgr_021012 [Nepenthes gracilis]
MLFARICIEVGVDAVFPTKIRLCSGRNSHAKEDTPIEVEVVYQWKPLRCTRFKKFGHGTDQCKPKIYRPADRILEAVPASVDQTIPNRMLATSR